MPRCHRSTALNYIKKIDSEVRACFITGHEVTLRELFSTMDLDCVLIQIEDLVNHAKPELASK
jgi:phosphohistidine phosphatase SixA